LLSHFYSSFIKRDCDSVNNINTLPLAVLFIIYVIHHRSNISSWYMYCDFDLLLLW